MSALLADALYGASYSSVEFEGVTTVSDNSPGTHGREIAESTRVARVL